MSIANWNPTAFYLIGDEVYYPNTSSQTFVAQSNNYNITPLPATPVWLAINPTSFVPYAGSFSSSVSENLPAGVQTPITYNTTLVSNGVVPVGAFPTSQLRVLHTGVYKVLFSAQLDKFGGGGTDNFQLWFRLNGTNILASSSEVDTTQQINQVMTVELVLSMNANDIIEVIGYTKVGAVSCRLLANPVDATHPVAIPSIITNIYRVA